MFSGTLARLMAKPSSILTVSRADRNPAYFLAHPENFSGNFPKRTSSTSYPSLSRQTKAVERRASEARS